MSPLVAILVLPPQNESWDAQTVAGALSEHFGLGSKLHNGILC